MEIKNAQIIIGTINKIVANEGYKITNKDRTIFSDTIYPPKGYDFENNPNGYEALEYKYYAPYVDENEIPRNKVEELEKQISSLQEDKDNLEFVLLDTNFRLTCMELKDEGILE